MATLHHVPTRLHTTYIRSLNAHLLFLSTYITIILYLSAPIYSQGVGNPCPLLLSGAQPVGSRHSSLRIQEAWVMTQSIRLHLPTVD